MIPGGGQRPLWYAGRVPFDPRAALEMFAADSRRPRTHTDPTMRSPRGRSPLAVFLLLGAGVFALDRGLGDAGPERVVTVTDEQVAAIRARWAAQWGRPPAGPELEALIDEAVQEEVLYREALRLGLDRGDPIVRRRLAQKMTFLLEDRAAARAAAPEDVEAYFAVHAERYREPGRTTFRHVFLSRDRRADPARDAAGLLPEVRAGRGGRWRRLGDPFMLLREYAGRSDQEIAELFGGEFAAALAAVAAGAWQGPFESAHGAHLVEVLDRTEPRLPALDEVRERVAADLLESRRRERNRAALQALRERYEVRRPGPAGGGQDPQAGGGQRPQAGGGQRPQAGGGQRPR